MDHWSSPNGCHPDCPACQKESDEDCDIRVWASNNFDTSDLTVDTGSEGRVGRTDDGAAWVQAWIYVSPEQVKQALSAKD